MPKSTIAGKNRLIERPISLPLFRQVNMRLFLGPTVLDVPELRQ